MKITQIESLILKLDARTKRIVLEDKDVYIVLTELDMLRSQLSYVIEQVHNFRRDKLVYLIKTQVFQKEKRYLANHYTQEMYESYADFILLMKTDLINGFQTLCEDETKVVTLSIE